MRHSRYTIVQANDRFYRFDTTGLSHWASRQVCMREEADLGRFYGAIGSLALAEIKSRSILVEWWMGGWKVNSTLTLWGFPDGQRIRSRICAVCQTDQIMSC
jgi:hypothetical protein